MYEAQHCGWCGIHLLTPKGVGGGYSVLQQRWAVVDYQRPPPGGHNSDWYWTRLYTLRHWSGESSTSNMGLLWQDILGPLTTLNRVWLVNGDMGEGQARAREVRSRRSLAADRHSDTQGAGHHFWHRTKVMSKCPRLRLCQTGPRCERWQL